MGCIQVKKNNPKVFPTKLHKSEADTPVITAKKLRKHLMKIRKNDLKTIFEVQQSAEFSE